MNTKKAMVTGAVLLAIIVPAAVFAASGSTVTTTAIKDFAGKHFRHNTVGQEGSGSGMTRPEDTLTDAQKAELTTFRESVKTARESLKSVTLTDADKATLKSIQETAQKAEREFLRSKGVTLPSEEAIASAKKIFDSMKSAAQSGATDDRMTPPVEVPGLGLGMMGGEGGMMGRGGRGGMNKNHEGRRNDIDRDRDNESNNSQSGSTITK